MEEYEHNDRLIWRKYFWEYCECNYVYEIDDILRYIDREDQCYVAEFIQIRDSYLLV